MKLLNSFSLGVIKNDTALINMEVITANQASKMLKEKGIESCVGHKDAASLYSQILGTKVEFNRVTVELADCEMVIVGQYTGPRLPEGCVKLPDGSSIKWILVDALLDV